MEEVKKVFEETVQRKFNELKAESKTYGEIKSKAFGHYTKSNSAIEKHVFDEVLRMVESEMESISIER